MLEGIETGCRTAFPDLPKAQCYARYHGMVVEYGKVKCNGIHIKVGSL
jgi:hypothetical protein